MQQLNVLHKLAPGYYAENVICNSSVNVIFMLFVLVTFSHVQSTANIT